MEGVTAAPVEEQCAIFIGHMYEFHYVSTEPSIFQGQNKQNVVKPVVNLSSFHDIFSEAHKRNWFYL